MKLKLDENFGRRCVDILSEAGHHVATVASQQMSGAADEDVIQICRSESRCLVSLDLDFANPLSFRPADYSGIAVIRLSGRAGYSELLAAISTLTKALETESTHMIQREKIEELLNLPVDERRRVLRLLQESLPEEDERESQSPDGDQTSPAAKWLLSMAGRYSGGRGNTAARTYEILRTEIDKRRGLTTN